MDQRQAQIRERAGLEESRLNEEFIEFLRKYSTPILALVAVVVLGYTAYQRYQKSEHAKVDAAFADLTAVMASPNPSPTSLKGVAEEHEGQAAVPIIARLKAGDQFLACIVRGLKAGADADKDGNAKPEDVLTDADRTAYLAEAEALYTRVVADTTGHAAQLSLRVGGMFGLAAVAECREQFDAARAQYAKVIELTKGGTFDRYASVAEERSKLLDSLKVAPRIFAKAELPAPPAPPAAPEGPAASGPMGPTQPVAPTGPMTLPGGVVAEPIDAPPFLKKPPEGQPPAAPAPSK